MHVLRMQHNTCKRLSLSGFLYYIFILSLSSEGGKMLELRAESSWCVLGSFSDHATWLRTAEKNIPRCGSRYVLQGDLHIIISAISPSSGSSRIGLTAYAASGHMV